MATSVSGMTFYEDQFSTGNYLGTTTNADAFNGASAGAITLTPGARKGRLPKSTFLTTMAGLIQARNPDDASGTLTPVKSSNAEKTDVKLFRVAIMDMYRQDWVDAGLDTESGTRNFGQQFAELQLLDYLSAVAAAVIGATTAIGATAKLDITGETVKTLTYDALNRGLFKLGDARPNAKAVISHSKPISDLIGTAFSSQQIAFQVGGVTIANGMIPTFGLQQVMSDVGPLVNLNGSATDTYNVLGLVAGAAMLKTGDTYTTLAPVTGTATAAPMNAMVRLRIDYEFELSIRGVSYTGAAKPNDAALATAGNWTLVGADRKQGPGVLIITQ